MTPVQYSALGAIGDQPTIDQATLAVLISYDRTTIGGVVDRLVDKGFVSRQTNAQDRRAKVLTLTEQGEAALSVAHRAVANAQDQLVRGLDAQERDELKRLLEKAVLAATEQRK
ncbi:MarR family transcriptional regulator [Devosia sp. MC521]|nr:MarR family transcriptional regulator [Devosia sp. MC521]QMW64534.1 MarR family transcriptional regulator [Devosia sp. MC521]